MTIFDRIVPLPQRIQWLMLKTALDGGYTASAIAGRLGWTIEKVYQLVWRDPRGIRLDEVAAWSFACDGKLPKLGIVPAEM